LSTLLTNANRKTVYIDEAGDDGFATGSSSEWFVLAGLLVPSDQNPICHRIIRDCRVELKYSNKRILHFRKLNHRQRIAVCRILGSSELKAIAVLIHKSVVIGQQTPRGKRLYLVETAICALLNTAALIAREPMDTSDLEFVFSKCERTDFPLILNSIREHQPQRIIEQSFWKRIGQPKSRNPQFHSGLQLADIVASSCFFAINRNRYGGVEERYRACLSSMLITHNS
jgi:hypothetical protein